MWINGAKAGQTLEIKINEIIPGDYGWVSAGGFPSYWNKETNLLDVDEVTLDFDLDRENLLAKSRFEGYGCLHY